MKHKRPQSYRDPYIKKLLKAILGSIFLIRFLAFPGVSFHLYLASGPAKMIDFSVMSTCEKTSKINKPLRQLPVGMGFQTYSNSVHSNDCSRVLNCLRCSTNVFSAQGKYFHVKEIGRLILYVVYIRAFDTLIIMVYILFFTLSHDLVLIASAL